MASWRAVAAPLAKKKKGRRQRRDVEASAPLAAAGQEGGAGRAVKMKRREYEREMRLLHGELVALQEWVKASGAKICIVFEGRDTAGKGGTIKRITERVSPRVFRVVALPAPTPGPTARGDGPRAGLSARWTANAVSHPYGGSSGGCMGAC